MSQSITAPRVSFEELDNSRNALPEEEAKLLRARTHGWGAIRRETPEMIETACAQLRRALERIENKDDYLRAMDTCPEVVRTETPFLFFLRCCDFDPWAAAQRLVSYWKFRKEVFVEEEELAFRPLVQRGGALSAEDLAFLRKGALRIVGKDQYGRTIIYLRRVGVKRKDFARAVRCFLYLTSAISRDPNNQRHGVVWIHDTQNMAFEDYDRRHNRLFIRHLQNTATVVVRAVHFVLHTERGFGAWIAPVVLGMIPSARRGIVFVHTKIRPEEFVTELATFGIDDSHLPPSMGGKFELEQFGCFLDEAESQENCVHTAS